MTREEALDIIRFVFLHTDNHLNDGRQISTEDIREALVMACAALCKNHLPSNLDEAAEEIAKSEIPVIAGEALDLNGDCYETDDVNWPERCGFIRGFKVGAEWMAGQGYTQEGVARPDDCEIWVDMKNTDIKDGDEVVVQIRKK